MKWLFDSCRRQRENLALLAAGVLSAPERAKVERHLAACPQCQTYFAEIKSVASVLVSSAHADAEIQPSADVIARWETAIRSVKTDVSPAQTSSVAAQLSWWREVIWPWRRAWIGLSGVWIILLAFHLTQHDVGPKAVAPSRTAVASFREQQKMLNELLADRSSAPDADRPKSFSPKPRTERDRIVPV